MPLRSRKKFWKPAAIFLVKGEGEGSIPVFLEELKSGQTTGVIEILKNPNMHESPMPRSILWI